MSPENAPDPAPVRRPQRPRWAILGERAIEALIRLSGMSAILFVAAIFFFVLREAAPVLFREDFSLGQFLFSTEWYPTSANNVRYGTLALTVGTLSVTALAMALAVPFGLGAAIYLSEFCAPRVRETLKVVIELLSAIPSVVWGFVGLTVMSKLIVTADRGAGRRQRPERRDHPRPHERAGDRLDRRGRAQGGARLLPRGRARPRGHPLAARLPGARARRAQRPAGRGAARASAGRWGRRWPC